MTMNKWRMKLAVVAVATCAMLASCTAGIPTTTATPTARFSASEGLRGVESLAPSFRDLPIGYALAEVGKVVSNNDLIARSVVGAQLGAALPEFERVTGYEIAYESDTTSLSASIDLFQSPAGAQRYFSWLPTGYASFDKYLAAQFAYVLLEEAGITVGRPSGSFRATLHQVYRGGYAWWQD